MSLRRYIMMRKALARHTTANPAYVNAYTTKRYNEINDFTQLVSFVRNMHSEIPIPNTVAT
jgi:hypothetical protein